MATVKPTHATLPPTLLGKEINIDMGINDKNKQIFE